MKIGYLVICLLFCHSFVVCQQNNRLSVLSKIERSKDNEDGLKELLELKSKNNFDKKQNILFYSKIVPLAIELQKFDLALKYAMEAELLAEKLHNDSLQTFFTIKIGGVYYYLYKKKEARKYFEKAFRLAHQHKLWELEAKALSNLGAMYLEDQDFPEAEQNLRKALHIFKKHGTHHQDGLLTYRLLATLYTKTGKFDKAKEIFQENIRLTKQNKDTILTCSALIYYAELLSQKGFHQEAIKLARVALSLQRIQKNKNSLYNILNLLAHYLTLDKQYPEAVDLYNEILRLNNSMFQEDLKNGVAEVEVKYKTAEIKRQKELAETKLEAETAKRNLYVFILLGFLLFSLVIFLLFYLRQKNKRRLFEKELEKKHLAAILEAQENEKVRIARDLHDGICQNFATTKMKFNAISEILAKSNPEVTVPYRECIDLLDRSTNELRSIAHEIMPPALNELGLTEAIRLLATQVFSKQVKFVVEAFGDHQRLEQVVEINIYRIAQELVANVVKHSKATEVYVQLISNKNYWMLMMEDNGIGIKNEHTSGMGMGNIQLRAEIIHAKFNIQAGSTNGTVATLKINVNE